MTATDADLSPALERLIESVRPPWATSRDTMCITAGELFWNRTADLTTPNGTVVPMCIVRLDILAEDDKSIEVGTTKVWMETTGYELEGEPDVMESIGRQLIALAELARVGAS